MAVTAESIQAAQARMGDDVPELTAEQVDRAAVILAGGATKREDSQTG